MAIKLKVLIREPYSDWIECMYVCVYVCVYVYERIVLDNSSIKILQFVFFFVYLEFKKSKLRIILHIQDLWTNVPISDLSYIIKIIVHIYFNFTH